MKHPLRSCISCRGTAPKAKLLRIVVRGSEIKWDEKMNLPGRGAYLHPKIDCLAKFPYLKGMGRFFRVDKFIVSMSDLIRLSDFMAASIGIEREKPRTGKRIRI